MEKALNKIYRFYNNRIFPRIENRRGAYFIRRKLEKLAFRNIPKIEETNHISELEWDNLIILDACRHDTYEEVTGRTVESRNTVGSKTQSFITNTFSEGDWSNTVYISGNVHLDEQIFKDLTGKSPKDVFASVFKTYRTDWNEKEETVMPEKLVRDSLTAESLFPNKRKIIHFIQPHQPFIEKKLGSHPKPGEKLTSVWADVERNKVNGEKAVEGYKENLEIVIPYVEELAEKMQGKTVVTSDHGNLLGEKGNYGQRTGKALKPLRKVPWEEVNL